jgi:hypothetical protein
MEVPGESLRILEGFIEGPLITNLSEGIVIKTIKM